MGGKHEQNKTNKKKKKKQANKQTGQCFAEKLPQHEP